jgi:hypothetical protein
VTGSGGAKRWHCSARACSLAPCRPLGKCQRLGPELSTFSLHVMANRETERSYYAMRRKQEEKEKRTKRREH